MKKMIIAILFVSSAVYAAPTSAGKAKAGSNIICTNQDEDVQFFINTKAGRVWYGALSEPTTTEVIGALFSGVYSSEKYQGEILGEMVYAGLPSYTTLIMRKVDGKPELEVQIYPKINQNSVVKIKMGCRIK